MANPCPTCRSWQACPGMSWYHPGDIRYCKKQCIWLINEFLINRGGFITMARDTWVIGTDGSGYTDAEPTSHSLSSHAPFELVCQIIGELESRLEATGKDGSLLVLEVHQGGYISNDGNNALVFISGKRKHMAYADWLQQRERRAKMKAVGLHAFRSARQFTHKLDKNPQKVV